MKSSLRYAALIVFAASAARCGVSQAPASDSAASFAPLAQWRKAVLSGDRVGLKTLYSTAPAAKVTVPPDESNPDADVEFWVGLKARSIDLDILQTTSPQPGVQVVRFQAEIRSGVPPEESETVYDCHVLDLAFHRPDFAAALAGYEVVHVDIGPDGKKNSDVAKQFQVPLDKGVPALAVADSAGKVLVSQKNGELENARAMTPEVLIEFLNKWKPETR
jgi:hypothetical protein